MVFWVAKCRQGLPLGGAWAAISGPWAAIGPVRLAWESKKGRPRPSQPYRAIKLPNLGRWPGTGGPLSRPPHHPLDHGNPNPKLGRDPPDPGAFATFGLDFHFDVLPEPRPSQTLPLRLRPRQSRTNAFSD